jgi:hypothetical protein
VQTQQFVHVKLKANGSVGGRTRDGTRDGRQRLRDSELCIGTASCGTGGEKDSSSEAERRTDRRQAAGSQGGARDQGSRTVDWGYRDLELAVRTCC